MFVQLLTPLLVSVSCQSQPAEQLDEITWPRMHESEGDRVVVHEPQIDSWVDHEKLTARAAVAVTPKGVKDARYAVMDLTVDTEVSNETRTVLFENRRITSIRFPNLDEKQSKPLETTLRRVLGKKKPWIVPLDLVIAHQDASQQAAQGVKVGVAPPPIFRSEVPAILVIFLGKPSFQSVKGTRLLFATNTNWDLLYDENSKLYYLLNGDHWLSAPSPLKGPWSVARTLPSDLFRLPRDKNWENVWKNLPGRTVSAPPKVFVSTEPSELILTQGAPQYKAIAGTNLFYVTNTQSDLFRHASDGQHYFLTAGRWFRGGLDGPWASAMKDLPPDFAQIPADHPKASVRVSVPGTPEAEDAILLASIPQKATVDKKSVKVTVVYQGDPDFVVIDGTTVRYASNSPYDVFSVNGRYYCCHEGIWFESGSAYGPWVVCSVVPKVIYTIPSTHPKHNVTYVYVYDSTPTTVVVGHTAGYTGVYVASGVVLFGLGWAMAHHYYHDHYHHYHYHSHYYAYGCGARYDYHHGTYYRSAHAYGPYGGAGRGAAYNPHTGTYSRGAYAYGPGGSRYAAQAYNPYTGNYAARTGGSNAYGSWGRGVVSDGHNWARGGYRSDARGTVGGIETSRGGVAVGARDRYGNSGGVAKNRHGDVYVGRDGNVYKRDQNGGWQKRENGGWSKYDAPRTGTQGGSRPKTQSGTGSRPKTQGGTSRSGRATGRSSSRSSVRSGLERDSRSRSRASQSSNRARRYGRSGGRSRSGRTGRSGGGRSRSGPPVRR